jgi:transcriptional regulator with XRE-family HTH domain
MHPSDYLKTCREKLGKTQEALVEALYHFDDASFAGLTSATLSRWERGMATPPPNRMAALLRFFQHRSGLPLPCVEPTNEKGVESLMSEEEIANLFKPKNMVNDVTMPGASPAMFELVNLRHHERVGELLELNTMLHQGANTPFTQVSYAQFAQWIDHPGNLFIAVTYKASFLGLLFALRLKPKSFEKVLAFSMKKSDLKEADFAAPHEEGSLYLLSLFSLSPVVATLLFRRLYAHLIASQSTSREVGFVSSYEEAWTLAKRLGLDERDSVEMDKKTIKAFRTDLYTMMRTSQAIKIFFSKEPCD